MRHTVWAALCGTGLFSCATGTPLGGRSTWADGEWRSFSPPAAERTLPSEESQAPPLRVAGQAREKAVAAARALVGKPQVQAKGKAYPDDCSGLVRAAFDRVGVDVLAAAQPGDNAVSAIYRFSQRYGRVYTGGRPVSGDLVFFRDTYDLNRDGRDNDGLTHVALVEEVDDDGTVSVIHRVQGGVRRYKMNLAHRKEDRATDGRKWNDYLRAGTQGGKPSLTAELFVAYATLLPVEPKYTAAVAR